jgi:hypothetical protein
MWDLVVNGVEDAFTFTAASKMASPSAVNCLHEVAEHAQGGSLVVQAFGGGGLPSRGGGVQVVLPWLTNSANKHQTTDSHTHDGVTVCH